MCVTYVLFDGLIFVLFVITLQFHTGILQVSVPSLLPASKGLEISEKAKLPQPETSFEEKYVIYVLTLQYKCSTE